MKILEFYTGDKTYMYPSGEIASPERIESDFPAITIFKHIIETDEAGEVCFAVQNFSAMKDFYQIDSSLDDDAALQAMQDKINSDDSSGSSSITSPQNRIADALEDLVVLNMPDEEVE